MALKQQSGQQCDHVDDFNAGFFEHLGCIENSNFKVLQGSLHEQELGGACEKIVIAIPREPLDFLRRAVEAGHPRSNAISLPDDLKRVVEWNRDADAYTVHKHRSASEAHCSTARSMAPVGRASFLATRTDCWWWFDSVHG